jgi:hypothetical protein
MAHQVIVAGWHQFRRPIEAKLPDVNHRAEHSDAVFIWKV